jgi:hypothetical protein
VSQRKPLQTLGDVLRRDYRRRWKRANPEKVREHYQASKVRAWEREQAARQTVLL